MTEYRPATGSCATCKAALGLASLRRAGVWYCSPPCSEGRPGRSGPPAVPAERLVAAPRRFFRQRRPRELNSPSE
ncbi:MAG: hypothetical protein QNK03_10100 [Myxococcota bacterium]|nr:hypothetical protein [Myxococcota bacterium]